MAERMTLRSGCLSLCILLFSIVPGFADDAAVAPVAAPDTNMTQQIEGFNLQGYTDGGSKSWDIKGEKADIVGNHVSVTNVDANSYGDQNMNLTARTGTLNRATGDINLKENVWFDF